MKKHVKFDGKILIIGCGSVSQCAIPIVLQLIDVNPKNITIMDFVDNRSRVEDSLKKALITLSIALPKKTMQRC